MFLNCNSWLHIYNLRTILPYMSVSRELLVIKNSKVLVTGKIIYMKYMCICMYFIHMCNMHLRPLQFTLMEVCTWDHSYKRNELQVEKVTYFFPMIEILMLQKRTDFQITPGIFLKKAFKMETSVTSTAAAVEKPPVYSRNLQKLSVSYIIKHLQFQLIFFLYLPYLSKYFYFIFLLSYWIMLFYPFLGVMNVKVWLHMLRK